MISLIIIIINMIPFDPNRWHGRMDMGLGKVVFLQLAGIGALSKGGLPRSAFSSIHHPSNGTIRRFFFSNPHDTRTCVFGFLCFYS